MQALEGHVIWLTGLSAAGKSTIAREVVQRLREREIPSVLMDGDLVRRAIDDPAIGHDPASRLRTSQRLCRLSKLLADQGLVVVVATMALFHELHAWNRAHLPGYLEVFLDVDLDILRARDPKGIYACAEDVVGMQQAAEFPQAPHLYIANNGPDSDVSEIVDQVLDAFEDQAK